MKRLAFCPLLLAALPGSAYAQTPPSTLHGGHFDDYLMVAADHESRMLSGYYDDGRCRFQFRGKLQPQELYQRRDFGEAYLANAAVPGQRRSFGLQIYSRAKQGYADQITLEPGSEKPVVCRHRITLDRAGHVSSGFLGVRVVRRNGPPLFQISRVVNNLPVLIRDRTTPPLKARAGVWVAATYSAAYAPQGYVYTNWYEGPMGSGQPRGGYIRERDLYPQPGLDD